jgi:crossover junction endodeoxyribonuclease RuvC
VISGSFHIAPRDFTLPARRPILKPRMRVLAIDPSLRSTGFALVEQNPAGALGVIDYGIIRNPDGLMHSSCLVAIRDKLVDLLIRHEPDCAAVEGVIYVQSYRTAITLGAARGAALLAIAERGLPIYEYAPRRVKQAVVGRGAADKKQVAFMVRALLGLGVTPPADAADAMAVALTHFQTARSARGRLAEPTRI